MSPQDHIRGGIFQRYRDFQPTGLDPKGLGGESNGIADWYVMPVSRSRDSEALAESNFDQFLEGLGGESDYAEVHRFGHWGPGWFEIILVKPTARRTLEKAVDMACSLERYPVLDDEDFSRREEAEAEETWSCYSTRDRLDLIERHNERCGKYATRISAFAARRDVPPYDLHKYLLGH